MSEPTDIDALIAEARGFVPVMRISALCDELADSLESARQVISKIESEVKNFDLDDNSALSEIERHLSLYEQKAKR